VEIRRGNNQEAFETSVTHMLTQGCAARTSGGCRYRAEKDRSCAIGCLMTDAEYDPTMEGQTVEQMQRNGVLPAALARLDMRLLSRLQVLHDNYLDDNVADLIKSLPWATETFGINLDFLNTPVLQARIAELKAEQKHD
jgi:hypothetical protein